MHTDDVRKTVVQAANLVERLSRVSKELAESNLQAAAALQSTTQAAPDLLRQAAQQTLGKLSADTAQSVRQGLHQPLMVSTGRSSTTSTASAELRMG